MIESIGAVTLATHDMPRAVRFYRALGFEGSCPRAWCSSCG
jgi:catechol 2,3-dioxygenase-like lactoylglutathione lyase family enzyme